jgi:cytochrome c biogenesis protein
VPFIPVEQSGLTSEGVIKVPDATPTQLGFAGVFLPSAAAQGGRLVSVFPAALRPEVSLVTYGGNLGLNTGASQSVYSLDLSGMHQLPVAPRPLAIGQSMTLPDGAGKITYTGYRQWISLAITYDPGQLPALISAVLALAGLILSFMVRRRRVFVRVAPGPGGGTLVEVGGLARSDAAGGFETEFAELARELRSAQGGAPLAVATAAAGPAEASAPAGHAGEAEADPAESDRAELDSAEPESAESDTAGLDPESVSAGPVGAGPVSSDHDQPFGVRDGE